MAISKERRHKLKERYIELLNESQAIILTEFSGLDVKQMEALRDEVLKADGRFHVTKNSLLGLALTEAGQPVPEEFLQGQTATGFVIGELPAVAKTFVDYAKKDQSFRIKGGILNGEVLSAQQVEALALLPSLDVLRAQLLGLISGPAQGITAAVASGVRQVINVVDAYAKLEEESEAVAEAAA